MTTQTPRRRADDWRETGHPLNQNRFAEVCAALGYDPEQVMAVRMNKRELTVTWADPNAGGMPRSTRHLYTA